MKRLIVGVVQKGERTDDFIEDQQGRSQQRAGFKLPSRRERGRIHMIREDRTPLPHRFCGHRTLHRTQTKSNETLGHLAVGLLPYELVPRLAAPEVDSGNVKKLPRGLAEQLNQLVGLWSFAGLGSNTEQ